MRFWVTLFLGLVAPVSAAAHDFASGVIQLTQTSPRAESYLVAVRPEGLSVAITGSCVLDGVRLECDQRGLAGAELRVTHWPSRVPEVVLGLNLANGQRSLRSVRRHDGPIRLSLPSEPSAVTVLSTYLGFGFVHVLQGFDHLLFVLLLVFLCHSTRQLLWTISAFTISHSITLALVTLGVVEIAPGPVEALISASIVLLSVEVLRPRQRAPVRFALVFGLLHGFGFAGALLEQGLPAQQVSSALLSFNLGVELGQITFVTAVLLLGRVFGRVQRRFGRLDARTAVAYASGTLAVAWTLERIGGGLWL